MSELLPCLDARGFEDWTCRTHDGTGLWCDNCLTNQRESLGAVEAAMAPAPPDSSPDVSAVTEPLQSPGLSPRWLPLVEKTAGCWVWNGRYNIQGYAAYGQRPQRAGHRLTYEYFVGPIPAGYDLDHLCENTWCVNPEHLDPVTHAENTRRGGASKVWRNQIRRWLATGVWETATQVYRRKAADRG